MIRISFDVETVSEAQVFLDAPHNAEAIKKLLVLVSAEAEVKAVNAHMDSAPAVKAAMNDMIRLLDQAGYKI